MAPGKQEPRGMRLKDLDTTFFSGVLKAVNPKATLVRFTPKLLDNTNGVLTNLVAESGDESQRITGLLAYRITYRIHDNDDDEWEERYHDVVVKIKKTGYETWQGINALAQNVGGMFASVYETRYRETELCNAEKKDMACVSIQCPAWKALMPEIYHVTHDPDRHVFAYAMEDLRSGAFSHLDSVMDITSWSEKDVKDVLKDIAGFHALYYGRLEDVPNELANALDAPQDRRFHASMADMWALYIDHSHEMLPHVFDTTTVSILRTALKNVSAICESLDSSPQCLIHNDFNPRNLCLRKNQSGHQRRLCLYDWEVIRQGLPQRDVAEFIMYLLPECSPSDAWQPYIDYYRSALVSQLRQRDAPEALMTSLEPTRFQTAFDMSLVEMFWNRCGAYMLVHRFVDLPFVERIMLNGVTYLKAISEKYSALQDSE